MRRIPASLPLCGLPYHSLGGVVAPGVSALIVQA